jgi:hypothetical protein
LALRRFFRLASLAILGAQLSGCAAEPLYSMSPAPGGRGGPRRLSGEGYPMTAGEAASAVRFFGSMFDPDPVRLRFTNAAKTDKNGGTVEGTVFADSPNDIWFYGRDMAAQDYTSEDACAARVGRHGEGKDHIAFHEWTHRVQYQHPELMRGTRHEYEAGRKISGEDRFADFAPEDQAELVAQVADRLNASPRCRNLLPEPTEHFLAVRQIVETYLPQSRRTRLEMERKP